MADEIRDNKPTDETPDTPEVDVTQAEDGTGQDDGAPDPLISAFDEDKILSDALGDDETEEADAEEPEADAAGDDAKAETAAHTDAESRGLEVLMTQRGFTAKQAERMLAKDPEFVREIGAAAIESDAETADGPGDTDAKGDTADAAEEEAKKTDDDADDAEDPTEKLVAVLGRTFDKEESATLAEAIRLAMPRAGKRAETPDVAALVEKQVQGRLEGINKTLASYDAALSDLVARREAERLGEIHPEMKTPDGYARVYAKAQQLGKTGQFKSIPEVMEAAATVLFGAARSAEARGYKQKVNRHRQDGVPTSPGQRAPAGTTMDRDDLVLSMSLDGRTETEIKEELARSSRR